MSLDLPPPPSQSTAQDEFERRMNEVANEIEKNALNYAKVVSQWDDRGPRSIEAINQIVAEFTDTMGRFAAIAGAYEVISGDDRNQYYARSLEAFADLMEPILRMVTSFELSAAWQADMLAQGLDLDKVRDELASMSDNEWDDFVDSQ